MLELKPMNQDQYNNYITYSKNNYAQEITKARGISIEEAMQITNKEYDALLSDGLKSKNQYLYTIENDNVVIKIGYTQTNPKKSQKKD